MEKINRFRGSLLGLATGDALGTALEFSVPGTFQPITDMIGGGPFNLKPGEWTDDTSMALCLAESLIVNKGFNAVDQLDRYCLWYRNGHLSSTGKCFDIGITVRRALTKFEETGEPYCGSTDANTAGNGSIMRLAPVPLFYAHNPAEAIEKAAQSSRTTHGAREAVDGCRYLAALIVGAVNGATKEALLSDHFEPIAGLWQQQPLAEKIAEIASGSFKHRNPPDIRGSGYVVASLEAALWAFYHSSSFKEGALLACNLGDDADTTAAVYGQLAGAYYGIGLPGGIPDAWLAKLAHGEMIEAFAEQLFAISTRAGKTFDITVEDADVGPLQEEAITLQYDGPVTEALDYEDYVRRLRQAAADKPSPDAQERRPPVGEVDFFLTVVIGADFGKIILLDRPETIFGRSTDSHVIITDEKASRSHLSARIVRGADGNRKVVIRDLGSRNGTFINGTKITEQELRHGDKLRVGQTVYKFEMKERMDDSYFDKLNPRNFE